MPLIVVCFRELQEPPVMEPTFSRTKRSVQTNERVLQPSTAFPNGSPKLQPMVDACDMMSEETRRRAQVLGKTKWLHWETSRQRQVARHVTATQTGTVRSAARAAKSVPNRMHTERVYDAKGIAQIGSLSPDTHSVEERAVKWCSTCISCLSVMYGLGNSVQEVIACFVLGRLLFTAYNPLRCQLCCFLSEPSQHHIMLGLRISLESASFAIHKLRLRPGWV
eukprot:4877411-Amphidinium_carterae.1